MRWYVLCLLCLAAPVAEAQEAPPGVVRVRVLSQPAPRQVQLEPADGALAVVVDGQSVGRTTGRVTVRTGRGGVTLRGGVDASGRRVELHGATVVQAGARSRTYAGSLVVSAEGRALQLVNHVPMPDYVASVVASEYPFSEIEGVKAQAVLARTYALRRRGARASYDLDDHQGSQVYGGRTRVTPVSRAATLATAGEALMYNGALAESPYSSSSGGHTANNESVWNGTPLPYLRGVPDPYDADAPDFRWRTTASRTDVHRTLSRLYGGRVRGLRVIQSSPTGRVLTVRLDGAHREEITGPQLRRAVNAAAGYRTMRSTHVAITVEGGRYVFTGRGFGHGVGMSQYGARGQARAGRSYRDILAHYFQGTTLDTVQGAIPLVADASPAAPVSSSRPFQAHPDDPVVRGSTRARRWPTPRRQPQSEASETAPPRRAW